MTDETTKTEPTEGQAGNADAAATKADDTVTIRKGELSGIKKQLAESRKALEMIAAEKEAEAAERAKKAQDFASLEKSYQEKITRAESEIAQMRRSVLVERARGALRDAGMRGGLAIDGAVAALPSDFDAEGIAAWVDDIRKNHPSEFGTPSNPVPASSPGATSRGPTNEADGLKAEWIAAMPKGPAAMRAVKAKIDAHIARTGKNPLA